MKTLNRPMFRYGGPIKEGVMNGIREPKQNGGTIAGGNQMGMPMGNRTGFADPIKTGGYFANLGSKAMGLFNPLKKVKIFGKGLTQIPKYAKDRKSYYDKIPAMERAGMFVRNNPRTTGALAIGATSDPVIGAVKGVGGGLKGIADFLTPGWAQRALEKDKKTDDLEKSKLTANEKRIKELQRLLDQKNKADDVPTISADEERQNRIQKYRDIMDIKGMNKDAAYNSLIAASRAISGEGDFKGSIRDGSLINKIIGSTSKAFDKPQATKDAIDTLILKGEIEKDINLSKGNASTQSITALANASGRSEKYIANAKLQIANSPGEAKSQLVKLKKGVPTSDDVTAVIATYGEENGIPFRRQFTTEEKNEKVGKGKQFANVTEFMEAAKLDPNGSDDGLYVVGSSVVQVEKGIPKLKG